MIRILHAADLHLDSPFEGLPAEKAALRRAEQRELLRRLAALRAEQGAQLVLLAGDLFDSEGAYAETEETLCRALAEMEVPVFLAPGNHDFYRAGGRWSRLRLPENAHVFTSPRPEAVELPALGVRVWGAAFTDRYAEGPLRGFSIPRREGLCELLCLHGEVGAPTSRYGPITEDELAASGADYAALGHVHSYSGPRRAGGTAYAWPGCPEGRGFDEAGEKGVLLADVAPGAARLTFLPTCARRYEVLRVDAAAPWPPELGAGSERNVYKITLTGEADAPPDLAALRRALEGRVFGLRLRDETRLAAGVWDRAGEDSLRGAFLRLLRARYDAAPDEAAREAVTRAARWGLAALDGREEAEA